MHDAGGVAATKPGRLDAGSLLRTGRPAATPSFDIDLRVDESNQWGAERPLRYFLVCGSKRESTGVTRCQPSDLCNPTLG